MTESRAPQGIGQLFVLSSVTARGGMPLIKLRKANQTGEDEGIIFVNTDQIVSVGVWQNVTELRMTDAQPRWVKDTPEEVAALAKSSG
jgi:hypothetical protein